MNKTSQWNSVFTFIMAMIGLTIGIGNIWRFSYILYSNGGGSFFIAGTNRKSAVRILRPPPSPGQPFFLFCSSNNNEMKGSSHGIRHDQ